MRCPKCKKQKDIIVQYYYRDGTRHFIILKPGGTVSLCGIKPAIWEKTEYICSIHGVVIQTLDNTQQITA